MAAEGTVGPKLPPPLPSCPLEEPDCLTDGESGAGQGAIQLSTGSVGREMTEPKLPRTNSLGLFFFWHFPQHCQASGEIGAI